MPSGEEAWGLARMDHDPAFVVQKGWGAHSRAAHARIFRRAGDS